LEEIGLFLRSPGTSPNLSKEEKGGGYEHTQSALAQAAAHIVSTTAAKRELRKKETLG